MLQDLLPVGTEAPRCSDFARSIDLRPLGTGLFLSRVVLVSVPLPWPKPALKHPLIEEAARHVVASMVPSRLFAAEPAITEPTITEPTSQFVVEVYERDGEQARHFRWHVAEASTVPHLVHQITTTALGALASVSIPGANPHQTTAAPTFLVCTQGSHDTCCGTSGVALADQIEQERPGYVVRRVSHTGGHRFSPTLLHFPEGRMWAFVDLPLVDRIVNGAATAADYLHHSRGWWGAQVGPAQVAEGAVRSELAQSPFVEPQVESLDEGSRRGTRFAVTTQSTTWQVDVHIGREIPTIACESPGGLPAKPGREFVWTIERQ